MVQILDPNYLLQDRTKILSEDYTTVDGALPTRRAVKD